MSTQIEKRPLLLLLAALIIGLTATRFPANLVLLVPLLGFCRSLRSWLLSAFGVGLGLILAPADLPVLASPGYSQDPIKIVSVPYATARDVRCEGHVGELRVKVVAPPGSDLHYGDLIQGGVLLSPVPEDREVSFREEGLQGVVRLRQATVLRQGPAIFYWIGSFQDTFHRYLDSNGAGDNAGWIEALWFRSRAISSQEQADLVASGSYSLVAASGLQVYLIFSLIVWGVGGGLRWDRRAQICLACTAILLYWLLTGMHGNTFRVTVTCIALASAYLVRREPDLCSITGLAGIVFLAGFPRSVYSLGFQLSMLIPISVGLFFHSSGKSGVKGRLSDMLRIVGIVFVAGQPLIAAHTGHGSVGQLFSTTLLGLTTPMILLGSFLGFLSSFVLQSLGRGLLIVLVFPLTQFFRAWVELLARLPLQVDLPAFSAYWLCLFYGGWLLAWKERERKVEPT